LFWLTFSKGNQAKKSPIDRISGSVFGRGMRYLVMITEHKQQDAYTVDMIGAILKAQSFVWLGQALMFEPMNLIPVTADAGRSAHMNDQDLLNVIPDKDSPILTVAGCSTKCRNERTTSKIGKKLEIEQQSYPS